MVCQSTISVQGPEKSTWPKALGAPVGAFLDAPRLVYTKLKASRLRDRSDVAGLINAGLDVEVCRAYLVAHAPDLVGAFDELVARAEAEE